MAQTMLFCHLDQIAYAHVAHARQPVVHEEPVGRVAVAVELHVVVPRDLQHRLEKPVRLQAPDHHGHGQARHAHAADALEPLHVKSALRTLRRIPLALLAHGAHHCRRRADLAGVEARRPHNRAHRGRPAPKTHLAFHALVVDAFLSFLDRRSGFTLHLNTEIELEKINYGNSD